MPRPRRLVEATPSERRAYLEAVQRLVRLSHQGERETLRATVQWLDQLSLRIGAQLVSEPWQVRRQAEILATLRDIMGDMTQRLEGSLRVVGEDGLDRYRAGTDKWWQLVRRPPPRFTADSRLASAAANHVAQLIQAVSDPIMVEFSRTAATVAMGVETPDQAIARMVRRKGQGGFEPIGPFKNIRARAEAIVRTETQRLYTLADEMEYRDLSREVPGTLFYWAQFSARAPRPSHTRTMLRSKEHPIEHGKNFNVAGYWVPYPHHPTLPASESVHCNCKVLPTFDNIDWQAVVRQEAAAVGITTPRQQTQEQERTGTEGGPGPVDGGEVGDPRS